MVDHEYEFVILKPENFEEVATFLDKHFFPRDPLVRNSVYNFMYLFDIYLQQHKP